MISGKEAFCKAYDGEDVEYIVIGDNYWCDFSEETWTIEELKSGNFKFRLKPRTVNLNGIEFGLLVSAEWDSDEPNKVKLEFNNSDDADYFRSKALEIFNHSKG